MRTLSRYLLSALPAFVLFAAITFSGSEAWSVQPQIGSLSPAGLQKGVQTEWTISGAHGWRCQEILFYTPGFKVGELRLRATAP